MTSEGPFPVDDLEFVRREAAAVWPSLEGMRVFISGGTGFFGRWLLESLLHASRFHGIEFEAVVLSRDPEAFISKCPHLSVPEITWIRGSVGDLVLTSMVRERFDLVVHLETEADIASTNSSPGDAIRIIVDGTRKMLELARQVQASRFLFTSTGAVYGAQPVDLPMLSEKLLDPGEAFAANDLYAVGRTAKREAELLCIEAAKSHGIGAVIARGFTFGGPGVPLSSKFAFGNFIRDALAGSPIVIRGDGTQTRTYMYSADLAVWLWTLLLKGKAGKSYNVGSEIEVSIRQLAEAIASEMGDLPVVVMRAPPADGRQGRYVPSTSRARSELGLKETFTLTEIVRKTVFWHRDAVKH